MEPPLSERPRLGGKGYQRDGAISRFSRNDLFILFYFIGFLQFFFKVNYFDSINLYQIYILSSRMIFLIILIIQGFIFSTELLIWFSPRYIGCFYLVLFYGQIYKLVNFHAYTWDYGLIIFLHYYYLCKWKLDLRKLIIRAFVCFPSSWWWLLSLTKSSWLTPSYSIFFFRFTVSWVASF
jgi:hypothetical protein